MASGARKTHFCAFSMIWAAFYIDQNHCYLHVLFSSQPQSTNFEQNLTRFAALYRLHFRSGRGHIDRLECEQLRLLTGVKGRKFETSSTKDTRDIHDRSGQHLRGLKFQQDNLVVKGLTTNCVQEQGIINHSSFIIAIILIPQMQKFLVRNNYLEY